MHIDLDTYGPGALYISASLALLYARRIIRQRKLTLLDLCIFKKTNFRT